MGLTIWAIIGLLFFVITGIISAEMDSALLSVATVLIGLLTLQYGFGIAVWSEFVANPLLIAAAGILYVALGGLYTAIWRWPEFIRQSKYDILSSYDNWAMTLGSTDDNSFDRFMDSDCYYYNANEHKERLSSWVGMWPFSLAWELSRKPAIWVWNTTYKCLGNMFHRIGRSTARKLHDKG